MTEATPSATILLAADTHVVSEKSLSQIAADVVDAEIVLVRDRAGIVDTLTKRDVDVVVLNLEEPLPGLLQLIHEIKLREVDPAVLVVSSLNTPTLAAEIANAGCERVIIRDETWEESVVPAVRHALRMRKLVQENRRLIARLTEANMMLEEKNRRLDEFSATIAHDIRGPLGGLLMKLEFVLSECGKEVTPRLREIIERSHNSAERLMDIVKAMHRFAKLGAEASEMGAVDLNQLVREAVEDLHVDAQLNVTVHIGELPVVWGNANLLRRVFLNLVANGIKYNDSATIEIHVEHGKNFERGLAHFAEIVVSDNGRGIPARELPQLFQLFFRGTSAGTADGTGMGLAIVQRIMELHFGTVSVKSEVGKGTAFTLQLPTEDVRFGHR